MVRPRNYAYLAGILDGEGCFHPSKTSTGTWIITISVAQKVPELGEWLLEHFGGRLNKSETIYGPMWTWRCGGKVAKRVLPKTIPYMIVKKRQAQLGLSLARRPGRVRQRQVARELKVLNTRRKRKTS